MKESLSEQEEVSTRRSRRARKRVQDSNFVFIWFWIPDLWIYLLARHVQGTFDEHKHESQMFSLSIVYWFFYYLRSDSQQTTKKARFDAICVQECPNFNIWGYGLRSKRFEGSRLYSKIILGLQAKKRWGSGLHGKKFRAPGPGIFSRHFHDSYYLQRRTHLCLKNKPSRFKGDINTAKVHYLSYSRNSTTNCSFDYWALQISYNKHFFVLKTRCQFTLHQ